MPTCSEFKVNISSIRGLFVHLNVVHKYESTTRFKCIDCSHCRKFYEKNAFRKHLQKDHNLTLAHQPDVDNPGETNTPFVLRA